MSPSTILQEPASPLRRLDLRATSQIAGALDQDGALVVRNVLSPHQRQRLLEEVRLALGADAVPGGTAYDLAFIERSPTLRQLLLEPAFLRLCQAVVGAQQLVVHRSAAIQRSVGSPQLPWHSDFDHGHGPPQGPDGVLNRGEWPAGLWFYLTGCDPGHGGLCVVRGSHAPDWQPPLPWRLSADRHLLVDAEGMPAGMDMPGMVAIQAEPGDLVLFASRTYHAAAALHDRPRLSCGLTLRPRASLLQAPWKLGSPGQAMLAGLEPALEPFFQGYCGIDPLRRQPETSAGVRT